MTTRFYLALLPVLLFPLTTKAQPVLNFNVEPLLGDTMKYFGTADFPFTDPGPAGPNQTWVLPSAPSWQSNLTVACVAPNSTPFASNYPGAEYCLKTLIPGVPTSFAYYAQTDSSALFHGLSFLGNIVYKNMPAWEQVYPMNYGAMQTGQFAGTKKVGAQITHFRTNFERHFDGYGTLSFGGGPPLANAIRIKTVVSRTDSLPGANGSHTRTLVNEEFYNWFVGGVRGYVAFTSEMNAVQMTVAANGDISQFQEFQTQFSSEWRNMFTVVGTNETGAEMLQDLFRIVENPVRDWLTILPNRPFEASAEVLIAGLDGKILFKKEITGLEGKIEVQVGAYPAGIYLVSFRSGNSIQSIKWVKQ